MRFFGQASGTGDISEQDGVLLIDSGVNYAVFNIAMLTSAVGSLEVLSRSVATAGRYFARRGTRWSIWLCEEMLAEPVRRKAPALLARAHLRRLTEAPGMIADCIRPPARILPPIECRPVDDAATRADFAHLTSLNFDIPFATCQAIYGRESAWKNDYRGYIAYHRGMAAATTAVVVAAGSIGIYSVSTLPQYRRKGYAEALMRRVMGECRQTTGLERSVLQATRAGVEMYRKLGYRSVSNFTVYMT